jgi:hypothetical protein
VCIKELHQILSNNATFLSRVIMVTGARFLVVGLRQSNNPPQRKSQKSPRPKKARQMKSKVKCMLSILLDIKGITKNSSWHAKQSIPHPTVMFYGQCVKMCEDFALNFGD